MIDDINAVPDYGDDAPPHACSSSAEVHGARFACGVTPGHAGKHRFQAGGRYSLPTIDIEWDDIAAMPRPAAYGAYKVGDQVRVTGTLVGVNNSDGDWVNVEYGGTVFTVEDASTNPDLSPVTVPAADASEAEIRMLQGRSALLEAEHARLQSTLAKVASGLAEEQEQHADLVNEILANAGDEYDGDEAADAIAVRYVRDLEAVAGRNAAGLRRMLTEALTALDVKVLDGDRTFGSVLADPAEVADAALGEMGQRATLDSRTPWGDPDITVMQMGERVAVVSSGSEPDDFVKVIAYGADGLDYYDSVDEWKQATT